MRKYSLVRKRVRGGSLRDFFNRANEFLQKHKVLSRLAKGYSTLPLPFASQVGKVGEVAGSLGYGRRRRGRPRYGSALRPAGMRYGGMLRMSGA